MQKCCFMASNLHLFGVVLVRLFSPQFSIVDSKNGAKKCIVKISARSIQLAKFGFDTAFSF